MIGLERLLCPCDFSDASQHAIDHAIAVAKWSGATITALHVYEPLFMPIPAFPSGNQRVSTREVSRVREQLDARFHPARLEGVNVDVVVEVGHPARVILDRSRELNAQLIVMGTHGLSGFEHLLLGSVTERVLRKAMCPVLTVPPLMHGVSTLPYRRILCAIDFSNASLAAWKQACAFARDANATLIAMTVVEWPWHEPPSPDLHTLPPEQVRALTELRRYLECGATRRLQALVPGDAGSTAFEQRVVHGRSYEGILRVSEDEHCDLVILGVHGRNVADMALFGSTTNQVVRCAKCPVLTWKEKATGETS